MVCDPKKIAILEAINNDDLFSNPLEDLVSSPVSGAVGAIQLLIDAYNSALNAWEAEWQAHFNQTIVPDSQSNWPPEPVPMTTQEKQDYTGADNLDIAEYRNFLNTIQNNLSTIMPVINQLTAHTDSQMNDLSDTMPFVSQAIKALNDHFCQATGMELEDAYGMMQGKYQPQIDELIDKVNSMAGYFIWDTWSDIWEDEINDPPTQFPYTQVWKDRDGTNTPYYVKTGVTDDTNFVPATDLPNLQTAKTITDEIVVLVGVLQLIPTSENNKINELIGVAKKYVRVIQLMKMNSDSDAQAVLQKCASTALKTALGTE